MSRRSQTVESSTPGREMEGVAEVGEETRAATRGDLRSTA